MRNDIKQIITEEIDVSDKILNQDGTVNFNSFEIKTTLNPDIFDSNNKLNPNIRKELMKIFNSIIDESVLIDKNDVEDVVIVGSIASYHYSSYSDIDFHIIVNMKGLNSNEELVKKFLDDERRIWNIEHHIEIDGYDVELYFQDKSEVNASNGCYSVLNNKWVKFPSKENYTLDKELLGTKALTLIEKIDDLCDSEYPDLNNIEEIYDKIVQGRKEDLAQNGEFSEGNIIFKILRRTGHLEKLKDALNMLKDNELSESSICPTITEEMEKDVRNYVKQNYKSLNPDIEQEYRNIVADVFGEAAWEIFKPDEQSALIEIINSEYNELKPDYIKNIMYENMKININKFKQALLESVKTYCKKNNTKKISKRELIKLVESQFDEEDDYNSTSLDIQDDDFQDLIAANQREYDRLVPPNYNPIEGKNIFVGAIQGDNDHSAFTELSAQMEQVGREHGLNMVMCSRRSIHYGTGVVLELVYLTEDVGDDLFLNKEDILAYNKLYLQRRQK